MVNKRNTGIDFLRILAMFYVVVLHVLGQGGMLNHAAIGTLPYQLGWFLEIGAYCAVDIFALISGYVSYREEEKPYSFTSYLMMWLQVVFYGVVVTLIFNFINPDWVTKKDLIQMFLPVSNGLYWYLTAYTGLFFLIPLLNRGIRHTSNSSLKKLLIVMIIFFSFFDTIKNRFVFSKGYSFIWLVILFILGAILKKCEIGKKMNPYQAFILILGLTLVGWSWKMYGFPIQFLDYTITKDTFVSYTSPITVLSAMFYIIGFSKLEFPIFIKKVIAYMAPSAFAVYLLNCQRFVWKHLMKDRFIYLIDLNPMAIVLHVFGFSLLFVLGSILFDWIRLSLFKILKVKRIVEKVVDKMNSFLTTLTQFLFD